MMRLRCWPWAGLALVGALILCSTWAEAKETKLSKSEEKRRVSMLRNRARAAYRAQQKMISKCDGCGSSGLITINKLKQNPTTGAQYWVFDRVETCPECKGRKFLYRILGYDLLYWQMRSPRFRAQVGTSQRAQNEFTRPSLEVKDRHRLSLANLRKTELVSPIHGMTRFKGNYGETLSLAWIWAEEKGKGNWYLYEPSVDGTWPGEEGADVAEKKDPGWVPHGKKLPAKERAAVEKVLDNMQLGYRLTAVRRSGLDLVLAMAPKTEDSQRNAGMDALRMMRELLRRLEKETSITMFLLHPWRDRLGQVETRPAWRCAFGRETYDRVVWKNLDVQEQVDVLDWFTYDYDGWKLWHVKPNEGAALKAPGNEAPGNEAPGSKDPSKEAPDGEKLDPTPPAPVARVVSEWVEYGGLRFPKPGTFQHGATIEEGEIGYKLKGLKTSALPLEVTRMPESWRGDAKTAVTATVSFSAQRAQTTSGATQWLRVSIKLKRAGRLRAAEQDLSGTPLLFVVNDEATDKVHVNRPFTINEFRGSQVLVRVQLRLDRAHALLMGSDLVFRWESRKGAELKMGREGVIVLADLLSRLPP